MSQAKAFFGIKARPPAPAHSFRLCHPSTGVQRGRPGAVPTFSSKSLENAFPNVLRPIVGPLFGLNSWNGTSALDEEPEHERQFPEDGGLSVGIHLVLNLRQQ